MGPAPASVFGDALRRLRLDRGHSLRDLAKLTHYSKTVVWEWETGRKHPPAEAVTRLDELLDGRGALAAAAVRTPPPVVVDAERVAHATDHPRGADRSAVNALHGVLAHMRRLEDAMGAQPLLAATAGPLQIVENLADEARGAVRRDVVDLAGQWAQFVGWLHAATDDPAGAARWYARTLEHATEAGNVDLVATALSMRGNLAWTTRRPGPLVGLSAAAAGQPASSGVRAIALQQQARGHALLAEAEAVDRRLDEAVELAAEAAEHPDRQPAWLYFHSPGYLAMQRGLAYHMLGRPDDAIEHLSAGLAANGDLRGSEFVARYVLHLAEVHADAGNRDVAAELFGEVRTVVSATGSRRLAAEAQRLARHLDP